MRSLLGWIRSRRVASLVLGARHEISNRKKGAAMNLSQAGLDLIKRSEGFRALPYKDVAGFPTVGYGHKIQAGEAFPDALTPATADILLREDVITANRAIERLVKVPLTQGQYDALVDFTFNLGSARLAQSTLLKDLNQGNYDAAAVELLRWDHAGAEEIEALKVRRQAEYNLWHNVSN